MRRRTLLVALAGLAVLLSVGAVLVWPPADRITEANFLRIKEGMTRAEVEAILGPVGDYSTGPLVFDGHRQSLYVPISHNVFGDELQEEFLWRGDCLEIIVHFNSSGRVWRTHPRVVARVKQTAFENLVWRAKRQWHRWFPE
jgi:hypothetical protein